MIPGSRPPPQPPPVPSCGDSSGGSFTLLHPDIIRAHILSRLDGPSLASAASSSSQLRTICSVDELWRDICASTWPSTTNPSLHDLISTFPLGFRSFYSDSYPILHLPSIPSGPLAPSLKMPSKLISAIDIFYAGDLLFSKVQETETSIPRFMFTTFQIDLLEPKESIKTPIPYASQSVENMIRHLEENLTLNWILVDPTYKRAVNLPSPQPVSVCRDWLYLGVAQLQFSSFLGGDHEESEFVECRPTLVCRRGVDGRMEVVEVSMRMEDIEGRGLSGKSSLVILAEAMEGEKRSLKVRRGAGGIGIAMKERFEEFQEMKRKRRERRRRWERAADMACIGVGIAIAMSFFLWLHGLFSCSTS
ncbi:F-box protein At2g27310-like isoform X1 [Punica granatum]|uniref:F-box domain-containing protein n=2 Tax=Punica granatum TaxID=22663 RepID=A0A218WLV9_PUNGR|nr:F-box protein At2g27310-like isoform X1 [Punica granatum]XP_031384504.1 F-box protein At2g27310-like isoform X1 [Punica granatum]OWM73626.1 hypothetical protein CDL15_Pgr026725 [Punica granatum]PKI47071.1 hypothetical protein CRG98_032547 [Punica granatum]